MTDPLTPVREWLHGGPAPDRMTLKTAVKESLAALASVAPGKSVEVRVPPFGAVQCVHGPRHTRGNPPNVVEMDARTWIGLAIGTLTWDEAMAQGLLSASGSRVGEVADLLPLI
jgi:hypothetical protein